MYHGHGEGMVHHALRIGDNSPGTKILKFRLFHIPFWLAGGRMGLLKYSASKSVMGMIFL